MAAFAPYLPFAIRVGIDSVGFSDLDVGSSLLG
jgi:hypothetical protein